MFRLVLNALPRVPLRTFSTSLPFRTAIPFVPPASLSPVADAGRDDLLLDDPTHVRRPPTPTFYTTRPDYYEALCGLQDAIRSTRSALKALHLYPLPAFALAALPPALPAWADRTDMGVELNVPLTASMYRQLVAALKELELYHRIAKSAGVDALEASLADLIASFESTKEVEARERRMLKHAQIGKRATLDKFGRSYTVGRRKTSTARVWMIKAQDTTPNADAGAITQVSDQTSTGSSVSALLSPTPKVSSPPTSSILVNAAQLSSYFPLPADREAVMRPLKLAGLLGAYNVFSLVRGGGPSGQSGALAVAIARACASHVPEVESILRKANLMKRDPRMVERKKTGLAKARKAYTWVKR